MVSRKSRKIAQAEMERIIKFIYNPDLPLEYRLKYITLINRLKMKFKVKPPRYHRLFQCRRCKKPLIPGYNAVFRIRSRPKKAISVKCLECGHVYRYVLRDS